MTLSVRRISLFCWRGGLLAVTAQNVESDHEFLGTESIAMNYASSGLQVARDGFHVYMPAWFPGSLHRQLHPVRALAFPRKLGQLSLRVASGLVADEAVK